MFGRAWFSAFFRPGRLVLNTAEMLSVEWTDEQVLVIPYLEVLAVKFYLLNKELCNFMCRPYFKRYAHGKYLNCEHLARSRLDARST